MKTASIIIPCHNEEHWIGTCVVSVVRSILGCGLSREAEIIVVANGCIDGSPAVIRSLGSTAAQAGIRLVPVVTDRRGKHLALNLGDAAATGRIRIYLDADVTVETALIGQLVSALSADRPLFASGTISIPEPDTFVGRCYARAWGALPLVTEDVPGCGLYAVSAAGRHRWGEFPDLHSDDKFVRLHFARDERMRVTARYRWPLPLETPSLLRVRRRWCEGNRQLRRLRPDLADLDTSRDAWLRLVRLAVRDPVSSGVFGALYLWSEAAARLAPFADTDGWISGRPSACPDVAAPREVPGAVP